jgi:hypothetical protein
MDYLSFRNFRQFERTRSEIRLPCDLLLDQRFRELPDVWKAHLLCLLLLAARMDNALPVNPHKLESLIGATEPVELQGLRPFVRYVCADQPYDSDRTARIHIPDSVRVAVLVRDGGRCRRCRSATNLEVDHLIPVSKGGDSDESSLQTLCRRCNRRKWKTLVANI